MNKADYDHDDGNNNNNDDDNGKLTFKLTTTTMQCLTRGENMVLPKTNVEYQVCMNAVLFHLAENN